MMAARMPPSSPTIKAARRNFARQIGALTGQGVAEWLDKVSGGRLSAGSRLLNIAFVRYAAAEAALGLARPPPAVFPAVAARPRVSLP